MNNILFTTGVVRSGTTLLTQILSVNKNICLASNPYLPLFKQLRNDILLNCADSEVVTTLDRNSPIDDYYFTEVKLRMMRYVQTVDLRIPYRCEDHGTLLGEVADRMSLDSPNLIPYLDMLSGETYLELFRSALRLIETAEAAEKSQWVGFILQVDGVSIYHAGDTDSIPEMGEWKVDVALLPVSGTYVMTAEEAAQAAQVIGPKVAIPMHYGAIVGTAADAKRFESLCSGLVVELMVHEEDSSS